MSIFIFTKYITITSQHPHFISASCYLTSMWPYLLDLACLLDKKSASLRDFPTVIIPHLFSSNGLATYRALVPNIITHWTATVFAISSNNGLSVASQAAEVLKIQPRANLSYIFLVILAESR